MNTFFVGLMTLMPAIVTLVFVVGVPTLLTVLLLPDSRRHTRHAPSAASRRVPAGYIRDIYHRTQHPNGVGPHRRAIPA
jgi:hypothetical protein